MLTPPPGLPAACNDSPDVPASAVTSAPSDSNTSQRIVVRQLRHEEWHRIDGCPALPDGFTLNPDQSIVVIAELDGEIIGFWSTLMMPHCEGFWVHPDHQKKSRLPIRIFNEMRDILDHNRVPAAFCWVDQQEVADYLVRLGMTQLPVQTFLFEPSKPHVT